MKDILLVAATYGETNLIRKELFSSKEEVPFLSISDGDHNYSLIHTGIGMVNTSFHLGSYLSHHEPDLMVHFGIGGSYKTEFQIGDVVELKSDTFGEMGANSPKGFMDLRQMGFTLMKKEEKIYYNTLKSPYDWNGGLPACKGLTVNEVSGVQSQIAFRSFKWDPDVESMEGAAFFHAALWFDIPFISLRSISNNVEVRNKENWDIPLACQRMQTYLMEALSTREMDNICKLTEKQ